MELVYITAEVLTQDFFKSGINFDTLIPLIVVCLTASTSITIALIRNKTNRLNNKVDNQTKLEIANKELEAIKDTNLTNRKIAEYNNKTAIKIAKKGHVINNDKSPPMTRAS